MCTSRPKVPKPTPVIERQAYKSASSRASLSSDTDPNARRRVIAGVATSARGVLEPASTTRRVLAGGDQQLMPLLSPAPSSPAATASPAAAVTGPAQAPQSGSSASASATPSGAGLYVAGNLARRKLADPRGKQVA